MKTLLLLPLFFVVQCAHAAGFDIKTSSIIDQPSVEVLGDYNNCWYVIGFETPNHPNHPARFYILKYAAGFPSGKSSPVYPPFGEKTDYLKAAIINGKVSIFYSRTEHLAERPDMVDSRDGYKQIPKIMRQDYDPVSLLPSGEPVTIFDETQEHFAASGIDIAQSEDKSKTAILIKHYFRQSKFKLILVDNNKGSFLEHSYSLKADKNLVTFRKITVNNTGQVLLEARTQEDPLHMDSKNKKAQRFYFFSMHNNVEEPEVLSIAPAIGGNQMANEPMIACLNSGDILISYDHYANEHCPALKGISITKYKSNFTLVATQDITPDDKILNQATPYQKTKEKGLENVETRQLVPLENGGAILITEFRRSTENKDKATGAIGNPLLERHYLIAYGLDNTLNLTSSTFIDKKQSAHNIDYAFSIQAFKQGNDVYLFHNENCEGDDEHGLSLLSTKLSAAGGEPVTQKIVHTSEDFFTSMEHIYTARNQILFIEAKVVDFSAEGRELKFLEATLK